MNIDELKYYADLTAEIEEQAEKLYTIALEEYPEQFGNFIKHKASLESFEIEGDGIELQFEELVGDWNDKYYFSLSLEDFLNEDNFRKMQKALKTKYLKGIEERKLKEEKDKEERELEMLNKLKQKYKDK